MKLCAALWLLVVLAFTVSPAIAQSTGAIAGVIHDATGGVLPGVTVEATSPALIEKVRTATSDTQGNYKVVDLQPGVYAVTFSVTGFNTLKREAVEVSAGFTANVSVELKVGGVEEALVVTGMSPIVDIQNVNQQRVLGRNAIDNLPTNRSFQGLAVTIPGVTSVGQDVGGSNTGLNGVSLTVHGSRTDEMPMMFDGLKFNTMWRAGGGTSMVYRIDPAVAEEITVQVSGFSAESSEGGLIINTVPRAGGNAFHGTLFGNYTNNNLQGSNLDAALQLRGIVSIPSTRERYEANGALGGPLKQDQVWFFAALRRERSVDRPPNLFYAVNPLAFTYTPDYNKPVDIDAHFNSYSGRVTWQASQKNKFSVFYDKQTGCICPYLIRGLQGPESAGDITFDTVDLTQVTWQAPVTGRLLFDAAQSLYRQNVSWDGYGNLGPRYSVTELSTGLIFRGPPQPETDISRTWSGRATMSYVTGSHAMKVGAQWVVGTQYRSFDVFNDKTLNLLNGVPVSVVEWTTPYSVSANTAPNLGVYAQDQWTLRHVTVNAGLRFEYIHAYTPAYHEGPVQYVGGRDFPEVDNIPNWKDIVPRLGVAWDLFGNGKTAVKASLGKYVLPINGYLGFTVASPVLTSVNSTTRSWTESDGDFIPQENELGPPTNSNFGKTLITTRLDPSFTEGWGNRPYNWEGTLSLQQELRPGAAVTAAYVRRWRGNFQVTKNLDLSPSDYDPYCITAPVDSRLPNGGGYQVCAYDINPSKFGQVNNIIEPASKFGNESEVFNGLDLSINARFPKGVLLQGGTSTGRLATDNCDVVAKVDNPGSGLGGIIAFGNPALVNSPSTLYCHIVPQFLTQVKLAAVYPLPWWAIQASIIFQSLPGPPITATYVATTAQIAPSLKRDLAGGAKTANLELIAPNSMFGDRLNQTDIRVAKTFAARGKRIQPQLDLYNLFNRNPVVSLNTRYGQAWLRPTYSAAGGGGVLPPRLLKFGVQVDF
jgi:hypothetical protein